MPSYMCAVFALALGLLAGRAGAGEEIMAMRGSAAGGRTSVAIPGEAPEASCAPAKRPAEIRFTARDDYVGWKSTVLRKPLMVAGGAFEVDVRREYAAARPYAQLPVRHEGFLARLVRDSTLR